MMAEVKATAFSLRAAAWAIYVNAVVCRGGEEDWHTSWDLYRHRRGKWPSAYADLIPGKVEQSPGSAKDKGVWPFTRSSGRHLYS